MRISRKGAGSFVGRHAASPTTRRVLNVFGSLAVAGALAWGGAGMAQAAGWNDPAVTIDSADSFGRAMDPANDQGYGDRGAQNIRAERVQITQGGALTVTGRLSHYAGRGNNAYPGMAFAMEGGSLIIQNQGSLASIDANTVTISGGKITLTGGAGAASAYIGGYQGLRITGGEIQMNENSQLFAGSRDGFSFTGGVATLAGTAGKEAHIMFSDNGANTIGGSAVISVTGAGRFSAQTDPLDLKMTGGALNIAQAGALTLGDGTHYAQCRGSGKLRMAREADPT